MYEFTLLVSKFQFLSVQFAYKLYKKSTVPVFNYQNNTKLNNTKAADAQSLKKQSEIYAEYDGRDKHMCVWGNKI